LERTPDNLCFALGFVYLGVSVLGFLKAKVRTSSRFWETENRRATAARWSSISTSPATGSKRRRRSNPNLRLQRMDQKP